MKFNGETTNVVSNEHEPYIRDLISRMPFPQRSLYPSGDYCLDS